MPSLHIVVDIDTDPTLVDPHEVALAIVADVYEEDTYSNKPVTFVNAEWDL